MTNKERVIELVREQNEEFGFDSFGELADFIIQTKPEITREIMSTGCSVGQIAEIVFYKK